VRSGDFVEALMRDSANVDEYAFALGAVAHYVADNLGHKMGTNVSVPVLYPKLRKKYGNVVTYEDDPLAHLKSEFGFDVLEVAKGRTRQTAIGTSSDLKLRGHYSSGRFEKRMESI
jgi:hypothetical protein